MKKAAIAYPILIVAGVGFWGWKEGGGLGDVLYPMILLVAILGAFVGINFIGCALNDWLFPEDAKRRMEFAQFNRKLDAMER